MAEQHRAIAEIQSALTVAKSCKRDEVEAIDRIKTACQRLGLAEKAEYAYSRGGTEITGPTIDLLTVIANAWGNIQFGFRELSQFGGESTVEAFAWDLETNSKRVVTFTVPHKRYTKNGVTILKDPRDIYEAVANYSQRRVRACLEAIIPPDVVEDAVNETKATLTAKADVTPESIAKLTAAFAKLSITKEQIEARLGRRLDTMHPAQLVGLRRIFKSIQDGMSVAADWFETPKADETTKAAETPKTGTEGAKEALKRKKAAAQQEKKEEAAEEEAQETQEKEAGDESQQEEPTGKVDPEFGQKCRDDFSECNTLEEVNATENTLVKAARGGAEISMVAKMAEEYRKAFPAEEPKKSKQKAFTA